MATLDDLLAQGEAPTGWDPDGDESFCSCTPATGGCDERCQNRAMQQECTNATCACGAACANRQFTNLCKGDQKPPLQLPRRHQRCTRRGEQRQSQQSGT